MFLVPQMPALATFGKFGGSGLGALWKRVSRFSGSRSVMQTYHYDTTVTKEGIPLLPKLPLHEGQHISVTIELTNGAEKPRRSFPLRGLPHEYVDPFEPAVPAEDWEALNDESA